MAEDTVNQVMKVLRDTSFALSTDGSNDIKLYPLLFTYFAKEKGKISMSLVTILECSDNTGEEIFNSINNYFKSNELQWENCLSFSSDNASNMLDKFKGVASFIKKDHESIIIRGCPCHLIHLAAKKASAELNINVEILLIDIYFFLGKIYKRKHAFKLCQQVMGPQGKSHKILKYCSNRWLSLFESITRILEQWDSLIEFFCSPESTNEIEARRFKNIRKMLQATNTKLYLLFLKNILPVFTTVNVILQQETPYIHKLRRELNELLMNLFVRFIKPSAISESDGNISLLNINFKKLNKQKDNEDLVIGAETKAYLKNTKLDSNEICLFYNSVSAFFVAACTYIITKFPLEDPFLKHAEVADVSLRKKVSFSSIMFMVTNFPSIVKENDFNQLEIEFAQYQIDNLTALEETSRIDMLWADIGKLKDLNGSIKYKILPKVMLAILVVPHSNAQSERVFSLVRKNQTDFRANLTTETLKSLLIEKMNMYTSGELCYKKIFKDSELKAAKHATYKSLNENA